MIKDQVKQINDTKIGGVLKEYHSNHLHKILLMQNKRIYYKSIHWWHNSL